MRFFIAVFFAASLASAYTVLKRQTTVPDCAQQCYTTAIANAAPCNATDIPCLCLDEKFANALTTCTTAACTNPNDLQAAEAAGLATCKAAGVDLQNPVPACATPCFAQAPTSGSCASTDDACLCKDTSYVQSVSTCVHGACTGQDLTTAELVGSALCRANGVDISSTIGAA